MFKVVTYADNGSQICKYAVDDVAKARRLVDTLYETTGLCTEAFNCNLPFCNSIYLRESPKSAFLKLKNKEREDKLMETAMRVMDIMSNMMREDQLDNSRLNDSSYMYKLEMFTGWARDFEYKNYGTDKYNTFWLELTEEVFTQKLNEEFGKK